MFQLHRKYRNILCLNKEDAITIALLKSDHSRSVCLYPKNRTWNFLGVHEHVAAKNTLFSCSLFLLSLNLHYYSIMLSYSPISNRTVNDSANIIYEYIHNLYVSI